MSNIKPIDMQDSEWTVTALRGRAPGKRGAEPKGGAEGGPDGRLDGGKPGYDNLRPIPTKRNILSKEEIEALLRPDLSDLDAESGAGPDAPATPHTMSDLAAPPAAPAIDGERIATRLTAALRRGALAPLSFAATPERAGESAPDGVHAVFENADSDPVAVLTLEPSLAYALVDALCGGEGKPSARPDPFSGLVGQILMAALAPLAGVLGRECGGALTLARIETETRFARLVGGAADRRAVMLRAEAGSVDAPCWLGLVAVQEGSGEAVGRIEGGPPAGLPEGIETRLCVRLARLDLTVRKVGQWKPGQTLLLGLPTDQPVEILSSQPHRPGCRVVAEGAMGRAGKKLAVKVKRVRAPVRRAD